MYSSQERNAVFPPSCGLTLGEEVDSMSLSIGAIPFDSSTATPDSQEADPGAGDAPYSQSM
jgi:hypothetical protein